MGSTAYERARHALVTDQRASQERAAFIEALRHAGARAKELGLDERLMLEIFRQGYAQP